jgi:xanthosine utilization system XapX-like protein
MAVGTEHEAPPSVAMMGLITGYWISQAVGAVYQRLFSGAGFQLARVIPTHSPFSVIEATRT